MCDLEGIGKEVNKAKSSFSDVLLQRLKLDAVSAEDLLKMLSGSWSEKESRPVQGTSHEAHVHI